MTTTNKKPNDAFAYLLGGPEDNSELLRIAALSDVQIGLPEKPAELQLTGRLSQSTAFVEVAPGQFIDYPPDATILLVSTIPIEDLKLSISYGQNQNFLSNEKIVINLPADPRTGQICYIKDLSSTADVCNIEIRGSKIDTEDSKILNYKNGCIGLVWSGISWSTIADTSQNLESISAITDKKVQDAIENYGAAASDASYVVLSSNSSLTNDRILTAGTNITITDDGPGGSVTISASSGGGGGDVTGPASSTDNAVVRFNLTTGKLIQNSGVTIDDSDNVSVPGRITVTGGTTTNTDANLGNAAVGSFPYYDGTSPSSFALFGHKDLDHAYSAVSDAGSKNYALVQDNSGNTYVNASTNTYVSLRCNNVSMLALSDNWLGTGTPAIFATGDLLVPTRTDVFLGNYGGASATTVYAGTGDLNVGHNSADRTVNLGTGNNNSIQEVTVGSTNDRSFLLLRAGTGNMILTGAVLTDYTVGHTAGTGDITLGRSTASNTIRIGNANTTTGNTQTINIGAGTPVGTGKAVITIGNTSGASSTTIKAGSGGLLLTSSAGYTTITGSTSTTTEAIIGMAAVGELPATRASFPNYFSMFGHKNLDQSTLWNYAVVQNGAPAGVAGRGDTFINSPSTIYFQFSGSSGGTVGILDNNTVSFTGLAGTVTTTTLGNSQTSSRTSVAAGTSGGTLYLSGTYIMMTGSIGINLPSTRTSTATAGTGIHIKQNLDPTRSGTTITDNSAAIRIEDDDGDGWIIGAGSTDDNELYFSWVFSSVGGAGTSTIQGYVLNTNNTFTQMNFTGQHRCSPANEDIESFKDKSGLIVIATGDYLNPVSGSTTGSYNRNIGINDATPIIELSIARNDKRAFGVISDLEDVSDGAREFAVGKFVSVIESGGQEDNRVFINAIGEGAIWICNINGSLENGDYITTCEIPGYGMKQDDDLLHNYTVAKITMNCNFDLNNGVYQCEEFEHEGVTYRRAFVGCTYHCG